jgi:transcriptional regulator with XRE-family HTH domain
MFIFSDIYHFDEKRDHPRMTISEIRRTTARLLAARVGGQADFARKVGMSDSQVSQLLAEKPTKNIGNIIARRIEVAFGLTEGWLDTARSEADVAQALLSEAKVSLVKTQPPREAVESFVPFYIDPVEVEIINSYRRADAGGKLSIRAAAEAANKSLSLGIGNQS